MTSERSGSAPGRGYATIRSHYDGLYDGKKGVWRGVGGRGPEFNAYLAGLVQELAPGRYLDVGCGEGELVRAVSADEKIGVELSNRALQLAQRESSATFCQAIAERLPFEDGCFDVVSSVGLMEHLLDDVAGTKEIFRVLRGGGHYVAAVHMPQFSERARLKIAAFFYPRFRPFLLVTWMRERARRWIRDRDLRSRGADGSRGEARRQAKAPGRSSIHRSYTPKQVERIFTAAGFTRVRVITKRTAPEAFLVADTFRIYVLKKPEVADR